jgi:hypothetical protein
VIGAVIGAHDAITAGTSVVTGAVQGAVEGVVPGSTSGFSNVSGGTRVDAALGVVNAIAQPALVGAAAVTAASGGVATPATAVVAGVAGAALLTSAILGELAGILGLGHPGLIKTEAERQKLEMDRALARVNPYSMRAREIALADYTQALNSKNPAIARGAHDAYAKYLTSLYTHGGFTSLDSPKTATQQAEAYKTAMKRADQAFEQATGSKLEASGIQAVHVSDAARVPPPRAHAKPVAHLAGP